MAQNGCSTLPPERLMSSGFLDDLNAECEFIRPFDEAPLPSERMGHAFRPGIARLFVARTFTEVPLDGAHRHGPRIARGAG